MNKKFTKLMAALALLVFMTPSMVGWGQTRTETTTTCTFSSKAWAADNGGTWTSGKDGNQFQNGRGVQVTTGATGANGTSGDSFDNVSKIVVTYSTNASKGKGTIKIQVGSGTEQTFAVTPVGTSDNTQQFDFSTTETGKVKITVDCTENSIYIKSVAITTISGGGSTNPTCTVDPTSWDFGSMQAGSSTQQKQFTVTAANLTSGLGFYLLEGTYYSIDVTGMSASETSKTITVTLNPTAVGAMQDMLVIEGDDFDDEITVDLTATGLCNAPATALAFTSPVNLTLSGSSVGCTLNPTASTGNGGTITYAITQGDVNHGILVDNEFEADALGTWVVTATQALNGTTCGGTADITINVYGPDQTITFDAGSGTSTPSITAPQGSTIQLPTATPSAGCSQAGWTFVGWTGEAITETTTAPDILLAAGDDYLVSTNETLYAVYMEGGGSNCSVTFSESGYTNQQTITEAQIGNCATATFDKGTNSNAPKYYTTGTAIRCYGGNTITISAEETLTEIALTFGTDDGSNAITTNVVSYSNGTWTGSANSVTFTIGGTSGNRRIAGISVTCGGTATYNSNPLCQEQVATPTFTPAAGTYTGAQNVTINCTTEDASILYKTSENGEWQTYSNAIPVSTTTTIWAKATNNGMDDSEVAEATYTIQYTLTVNIDDVVEYLLYDYTNETWDEITIDNEGHALVSSGADVRISGGEVYDDCYEVQSFDVTDGNDDPVTVVDNTEEDGTYSFIMPASNATLTATLNEIANHYTLTVEGMEHVSFEMLVGSMSTITSLNANHEASICEGSEVTISELTVDNGYALETVELIYGHQVYDITPTSDVCVFDMPSSNVVLIIIVREIHYTYTLATTIESGKSYIIVGQDDGNYFAMGQQNTNNRAAVGISVDVNNNKATVASDDVYEFVIESVGENLYSIYDARNNNNEGGYLYAASSGSNNLKTEAELDANGKWAISIGEGGVADVVAQGTNTRNYMRFNINSSNNNPLFSCYASTSDLPKVYLFEKTYTYTLTIEGYGESTGGYYLIASPVTVDPEDAGMITDHFTGEELTPATSTYDLYYFDQTAEKEWKNYRNSTFDLVPGTGYLYASKEGGEFTLTGDELYNGDGIIPLTQGSGNWADWNLIGNPFGVGAVIYNDYYVMNPEGSGLVPGVDHHVTAMQGVFVKYDPELVGACFYPDSDPNGITSVQSEDRLVFNLLRNRGTLIDRAIVRFGEGRQMTKFTLFENNTKLYIPLEDDDYAIVRSEAQGELPVSFRAGENGTYTLSMNVENVDMNYLHLIDNMTGMDIDLLQTPSYTFEANTNDYANRFKLVFAANSTDEADESSFAFFSNGNLIVNNEGNATLQVIDINGRILSSETISGSCSKAINATTGVYMLRLINGENVKVQKVVVR